MHFPFVQFPTVITSGLSIGFATVCYLPVSLSLFPLHPFSLFSPSSRLSVPGVVVKAKIASVHVYSELSHRDTLCKNTDFFFFFFFFRAPTENINTRESFGTFNYTREIDSIPVNDQSDTRREPQNENLMKINTRKIHTI